MISPSKLRGLERKLSKVSNKFKTVNSSDLKPLPDTWDEFVRLLKIRSGGKVVPFEPYDYQEKIIREFERNSTILVKSRQLGLSELTLSYMLFYACRNEGYTGLIVSLTGQDSGILAKRCAYMLASLDEYVVLESDSLLYIKVRGGGEIYFRSGRGQSNPGRGIPSISHAMIDEAAVIDNLEEAVNAIIPATSMVGNDARLFIISTPNGRTGYYAERLTQVCPSAFEICDQIRTQAIEPFQIRSDEKSRMSVCFVSWREHPIYGRNPNFLEEKSLAMGLTASAVSQEYDLNFSVSEANVFSTDLVYQFKGGVVPEKIGESGCLYYVGIDTASGDGGDYLVAQFFKCTYLEDGSERFEMVQQYRSNKNSMQGYVFDLVEMFERFEPFVVSYESNGTGKLYADELARLYPTPTYHKVVTTRASKESMIENIKYLIETDRIKLPSEGAYSKQLCKEMLNFKLDADGRMSGGKSHDDCVMALAIACDGIGVYGVGRGKARFVSG